MKCAKNKSYQAALISSCCSFSTLEEKLIAHKNNFNEDKLLPDVAIDKI
jgi:hypothetical protein